jgi:hypothetical protein
MAPPELLESILGVGSHHVSPLSPHLKLGVCSVLPSMATKSLIVRMIAMAVSHVYCPFTLSGQAHRLLLSCPGN